MNIFLKFRLQIPRKHFQHFRDFFMKTLYQYHHVKYLYIRFIIFFICFFVLLFQDHFNQGIHIACICYSMLFHLCDLRILSYSGGLRWTRGMVFSFVHQKKNLQSWNVRGEELFFLSLFPFHRRVLSSLDTSLISCEASLSLRLTNWLTD